MAEWHQHLKLTPDWAKAEECDISVQEMAQIVANRLENLEPIKDYEIENERQDLIGEFQIIAEDITATEDDIIEEFDELMEELYDWADQDFNGKKVCWVKTI